MKYLCLLFGILANNAIFAADLKLEIHGASLAGKTIFVAVYTVEHARDFPMRDQFARTDKVTATADVVELLMPNFTEGEYAVAVFADMNGNNKLDSNIWGIPKESVGVSRDAQGRFGPPKFADAAFKIVDGTTPIRIQLH